MNVDWSKQYDTAMPTGVEAKVGKLYVWSGLGLSFRSMAGNIKSIRRRQPLLCIEIDVVGAMGGKLCRFIDRNGERFVLFVENCYLLTELTEYVLAELLAQQLIISAAANNPPHT